MAATSRPWGRYVIVSFAVLVVLLAVGISATIGWRPIIGPKRRATDSRVYQATPERLKRGEYLVNNVSLCFGCHTHFDAKGKDIPEFTTTPGAGNVFIEQGEFKAVAHNLTPDPEFGLGRWTDDEIGRAIREGISRDGHALLPAMPYKLFHNMSDEDLASIIVYLRSRPAVHNNPGTTSLPFMVRHMINNAPEPITAPVTAPPVTDKLAYGRYLMHGVADCQGCHTPMNEHMEPMPNYFLAGGNIFAESGTPVASANITPDDSGIGYYNEATFVETMRTGKVRARKLNAMMPWWAFRNMSDDDLTAIYAYLRTIKPVKHRVDNTEQRTLCPIDGQKHGLGKDNAAPAS
jgi:mono/diheme cytochrome c family protein